MIDSLLGVLIWMQSPEEYKLNIYDQKYEEKINQRRVSGNSTNKRIVEGSISWYDKGKYKDGTEFKGDKLTTACKKEDRGKTFHVSYGGKSVDVLCNDYGNFITNGSGRTLDLSVSAFEKLAPRSVGIIKAKIEIIKELE